MSMVRTLGFELANPRFLGRRLRRQPLMEVTLDEMAAHLPQSPTILEAGACDGVDTVRLARRWPAGTVHAFEPVPEAYATVVQRTRDEANVVCHRLALSDSAGTAEIHLSEDESGSARPDASSLLEPTGHLEAWPSIKFRRMVSVETVTLDGWARERSLTQIDLMWLDLQGMELRVLSAAPEVVARTSALYVEAWRTSMYDGASSYDDLMRWASTAGFRPAVDCVHRVYGNVLLVRDRSEPPVRAAS